MAMRGVLIGVIAVVLWPVRRLYCRPDHLQRIGTLSCRGCIPRADLALASACRPVRGPEQHQIIC